MSNPFHILGLENTYALNDETLEKHYFDAQRKTHPDQFSQATAQEKAEAVQKSTTVNQAYLTLKNPLSRAEYLLQEAGHEPLSHDPSFLGTVMMWNERLDEGEDLTEELLEKQRILFQELEDRFAVQDFEKIRSVLYQLTYVEKLLKRCG